MTLLCPHHTVVVRNLADKVHVGDSDVENATAMYARCCLDCIALQAQPDPTVVDTTALDEALAALTEGGVLRPDQALEAFLRNGLGLPPVLNGEAA